MAITSTSFLLVASLRVRSVNSPRCIFMRSNLRSTWTALAKSITELSVQIVSEHVISVPRKISLTLIGQKPLWQRGSTRHIKDRSDVLRHSVRTHDSAITIKGNKSFVEQASHETERSRPLFLSSLCSGFDFDQGTICDAMSKSEMDMSDIGHIPPYSSAAANRRDSPIMYAYFLIARAANDKSHC